MNINYSIIIPHYNIPNLLRRLLLSIPKRDDVQVIVVDDCSTKNLAELSRVKSEFPNIEFYSTEENGGGGKARNIGLKQAQGKYLIFADADDYFSTGFGTTLETYKNSSWDVIYFPLSSHDEFTSKRFEAYNENFRIYQSNPAEGIDKIRYHYLCPWSKFISHNIILKYGINFEESIIHNDVLFSAKVGIYANKIKIVKEPIYTLMEREQSVSKILSNQHLMSRMKTYSQLNALFKEKQVSRFDMMMLTPLILYFKRGDILNFLKCLRIAKKYNFTCLKLMAQVFKITN